MQKNLFIPKKDEPDHEANIFYTISRKGEKIVNLKTHVDVKQKIRRPGLPCKIYEQMYHTKDKQSDKFVIDKLVIRG